MYDPSSELVSLDDILASKKVTDASVHCLRTPMLSNVETFYDLFSNVTLHMKLENFQTTGYFIFMNLRILL